jgi:hypothetical protein
MHGGIVGALEERHEGRFRVAGPADGIIGQHKLPEALVEIGGLGCGARLGKTCGRGIGVGVEGREVDPCASRPEPGGGHFVSAAAASVPAQATGEHILDPHVVMGRHYEVGELGLYW